MLGSLACVLALALSSPADAAIDFRADFEGASESVFGRGWWMLQREFDRPVTESFSRVRSPVRQGEFAGKFSVRHGYSPYGWNESTEVSWRPPKDQGPGSEYYYAFSTLFPTDWVPVWGWGLFLQFYTERFTVFVGSPPIAFDVKEERIRVHVRTGRSAIKGEPPRQHEYAKSHLVSPTLSKGKWNDFVVRARWASDSTGLLEIWHRTSDSGSFRKAVSLHRIPTLRWHHQYGADRIGSIKLGLYRKSNCSVPVQLGCTGDKGVQGTSVLYHDGFVRGKSFSEVVAAAFAEKAVAAKVRVRPKSARKATKSPRRAAKPGVLTLQRLRQVIDPGCSGCSVIARGAEIRADVAGGADHVDTAYRLLRFADPRGVAGRVVTTTRMRLGSAMVPRRNLAVLQVRDIRGQLVYELYVSGSDRTLRLWSPAGGLRSSSINESTGVVVPNDGSSVNAEVSALRNSSVVVRVNGRTRLTVKALRGARTGNPRFLRVGIDHYDASGTNEPMTVFHSRLRVSR